MQRLLSTKMKRSNTRSRTTCAATGSRSKDQRQGNTSRRHTAARTETTQSAWHDAPEDIDDMDMDGNDAVSGHSATSAHAAEARRRIEMLREEQLLREALSDIF